MVYVLRVWIEASDSQPTGVTNLCLRPSCLQSFEFLGITMNYHELPWYPGEIKKRLLKIKANHKGSKDIQGTRFWDQIEGPQGCAKEPRPTGNWKPEPFPRRLQGRLYIYIYPSLDQTPILGWWLTSWALILSVDLPTELICCICLYICRSGRPKNKDNPIQFSFTSYQFYLLEKQPATSLRSTIAMPLYKVRVLSQACPSKVKHPHGHSSNA